MCASILLQSVLSNQVACVQIKPLLIKMFAHHLCVDLISNATSTSKIETAKCSVQPVKTAVPNLVVGTLLRRSQDKSDGPVLVRQRESYCECYLLDIKKKTWVAVRSFLCHEGHEP